MLDVSPDANPDIPPSPHPQPVEHCHHCGGWRHHAQPCQIYPEWNTSLSSNAPAEVGPETDTPENNFLKPTQLLDNDFGEFQPMMDLATAATSAMTSHALKCYKPVVTHYFRRN